MTPATALALAPYREDEEVVEVQAQARTIADEARDLVITDEVTNNIALDMLSQSRKAVRRIDDLKKRWLDPLTQQVNRIRDDFTAMAAPAKEADAILARKTSDWRMKVQEAARKEQERLRLLAEKRQAAAVAKAEAKGVEPPVVMPIAPTVAPPAKTVETDTGAKVTYRKQFHFQIADPALLPREYLMPDEVKIRRVASAGVEIPGVKVWYTEEATVR